ncbi:hypothetical protein JOC94_001487 [Bacillus thermophilus]|uniref:Uncharacterized protein n=1 Tax=Siminovitchia thermophila TaxID=1245522 RepID=A0ABS2R535_9BACI|nr:hypothetical protein [Siminovitchia thermophila]MBM7714515.1 hypothetical protein [Siminovitchia thermophila]ONK24953.1 hypothetical protein BLX87_01910 [Bacillus sp. VT-16-64]
MKQVPTYQSLEILISDLIFMLGKANEKIHSLTDRVYQLELLLEHFPGHPTLSKQHISLEKK